MHVFALDRDARLASPLTTIARKNKSPWPAQKCLQQPTSILSKMNCYLKQLEVNISKYAESPSSDVFPE